MDFVAIDFETADRRTQAILSCGLVTINNGKIASKKHWLINPGNSPITTSEIHGITKEMVLGEPTFDVVWREIRPYIDGQLVLAHNAKSADINYLIKALDKNIDSIEIPAFEFFCAMEIARVLFPGEPSGLESLASRFQIDHQHHNALSDAMAAAKVVLAIFKQFRIEDQRHFLNQRDLVYPFSMNKSYLNQSNSRYVNVSHSQDQFGNIAFDERLIRDRCKDQAEFDRGQRVFDEGNVEIREIDDEYCKGEISGSGSKPYQTEIDYTLGKSKCDCQAWKNSRSPKFCKHCAALAMAWLAKGGPPENNLILSDELLDWILIASNSQSDEEILGVLQSFDDSEAWELINVLLQACPDRLIEIIRSLDS